jgi:hypothetical protein
VFLANAVSSRVGLRGHEKHRRNLDNGRIAIDPFLAATIGPKKAFLLTSMLVSEYLR